MTTYVFFKPTLPKVTRRFGSHDDVVSIVKSNNGFDFTVNPELLTDMLFGILQKLCNDSKTVTKIADTLKTIDAWIDYKIEAYMNDPYKIQARNYPSLVYEDPMSRFNIPRTIFKYVNSVTDISLRLVLDYLLYVLDYVYLAEDEGYDTTDIRVKLYNEVIVPLRSVIGQLYNTYMSKDYADHMFYDRMLEYKRDLKDLEDTLSIKVSNKCARDEGRPKPVEPEVNTNKTDVRDLAFAILMAQQIMDEHKELTIGDIIRQGALFWNDYYNVNKEE